AVFHTVGIWRWNSDMETGNYVPHGESAPAKLAESRIQSEPGSLCQFSYAIGTNHDKTLWEAQTVFEKLATSTKGFNRSKKTRRSWQNGSNTNSPYVLSSQMFLKRTQFTSRKEASVSYPLHPWIANAAKNTSYFPNPDRPAVFEPLGSRLCDIKDCNPPYLRTGDLVWISFFVEFIIGMNNWSTTFTLYEFVRVGTVSPDLVGDA
ncbi:hypothetical protein OH77DRAFT_1374941, partial [Trametes cingulata]